MQDGASCHTAKVIQHCREREQILLHEHKADSSDLNPIEAIWHKMKERLELDQYQTFDEFKAAIVTMWNAIPQEEIQSLIDSMPRRC